MKKLLSPKARLIFGILLLVGAIILWPLSQFTFAKSEPPFILALSFLAIILTALDMIYTALDSMDK